MKISVTAAKAQLTDLVRRAEAGDEVVLTRHGEPAARLVAVVARPDRLRRKKLLAELAGSGLEQAGAFPDAAHSQDFLYDDDGLPA